MAPWSGRGDLNPRPPRPKRGALPPRHSPVAFQRTGGSGSTGEDSAHRVRGPSGAEYVRPHRDRTAVRARRVQRMSIIVTVEFPTQPGKTEDLKVALKGALPDTRTYDGCEKVIATTDLDTPTTITLVEKWASRPQYETYLQWRMDTGLIDAIGPFLAGPPVIK